jgi:hypothetical protein
MPLGRRCDRAPRTDLFRRQVTAAPRNGYRERAALAVLPLDRYGAAVQLDQLLDQREADAGALVRAAMGTRNAPQSGLLDRGAEDAGELCRGDRKVSRLWLARAPLRCARN